MRQLSFLFLGLGLSALLLTACGDRKPSPVVEPTPTATTAPASPPPAAHALTFDEARTLAAQRQVPLLLDFHAPWCYSCYYMATHVLNGVEWEQVERRAVVVQVDADAPEGAALKARYGIKALPSYLVLDTEGEELGRILAEKTRAEFYPEINAILDRGQSMTALAAEVNEGSAKAVAAARTVLRAYLARYDAEGGLRWVAALPDAAVKAVNRDAEAALLVERLRFMQAAQAQDTAAALSSGQRVLAGDLGCERAYELDRYLAVIERQPDAQSRLAAQRPAMDALVAEGVFGERACADRRSVILSSVDLYGALGDRKAQHALLERAIADVAHRIDGAYGQDRNLDDNLRVYSARLAELTGDYSALDTLMPKLIAAWPEDYVYAYRHGRSLLARGDAAAALPYLEQAAAKAYGINRLNVAEQRVTALQTLDREPEARRVVAEALKANGPWFPDEAARLKALLKG